MKNKPIKFMLSLFLLIESLTILFSNISFATILPCHCADEYNSSYIDGENNSPSKYIDIFWTESNIKFLSDDERKVLEDIQNKMSTNNRLNKEDIEQMATLKDIVFKNKLSEIEYSDFKEILNKKKNREQLSTEEVVRLKDYFNSIK